MVERAVRTQRCLEYRIIGALRVVRCGDGHNPVLRETTKLVEEERLDTLHNHWANVFDDEGTWGESTSMFEDLTKGKPGPTLAGVNTVVL